jgi:type VI secretion system protein ImpA
MPLREDILNPIPGDNPSGQSLRWAPIYDQIKELRREDDELNQGAWQHERKVANHPEVIKVTQELIATQSKDLQLAAWLCESLLKKDGIRGLLDGLHLCRELVTRFWDTLYPLAEEGDFEERAAPLEWVGTKLVVAARGVPLCRDGYNLFQYQESRTIMTEDLAQSKEQKAAREKALKEGKLAPEIFDRAFAETPKAFYADLEKTVDGCSAELKQLETVCAEKFGDAGPSLSRLREALVEVRQVVHSLLQKKREIEPDPVEETPPEQVEAGTEGGEGDEAESSGGSPWGASLAGRASTESADRREAIASVVAAAAVLRKKDPFSPAPYLMLRGLRWGELRGSSDPGILEAPPSDLRQQVKALAMRNKWADLIELAEHVMTLPCSRAWLDLQRFVVEACTALGDDYNAIAIAIRSELRTLLRDLPKLMHATLSDDTAAANAETQKWLNELIAEPSNGTPSPSTPMVDDARTPGWQKKFIDPNTLAVEAVRTGQPQKAVEILQREVERQRSGRGQFQRKLQLAQICIAAGKDAIAQPLLDDILAKVDAHKLEEWEDPETVAAALSLLVQSSKKVQADAKLKQAMFERICRLDPVRAFSV